jgi:NADH:ubiquinone oxidoreductase subunit 4 (subunit M)
MNAKTHATILKAIIVIEIIGGILFVTWMCVTGTALNTFCGSFVALAFLWLIVLFLMPVRCHKPGCQGRMKRNWIKEPNYQSRLQYECENCGEIFDTNITIDLGEPW